MRLIRPRAVQNRKRLHRGFVENRVRKAEHGHLSKALQPVSGRNVGNTIPVVEAQGAVL
jgi:hypothetical protein